MQIKHSAYNKASIKVHEKYIRFQRTHKLCSFINSIDLSYEKHGINKL